MDQERRPIPEIFPDEAVQARFNDAIKRSGRAPLLRIWDANPEPETLMFFLTACCGGSSVAWRIDEYVPHELANNMAGHVENVRDAARLLARYISDIYGWHEDEFNPIRFLEIRAETKQERALADDLWLLPGRLEQFSDLIDPWWAAKGHPRKRGAVNLNYLQAHFRAYTEALDAQVTFPELAKLLNASRTALLIPRSPHAESLKAIVSTFRKRSEHKYEGLKQSVRCYMDSKRNALHAGKAWNYSYVGAAGYLKFVLPMLQVACTVNPVRRRERSHKP